MSHSLSRQLSGLLSVTEPRRRRSRTLTGGVLITAASVPEPSSIVLGLAGTLILLGVYGLRRVRRFRASPS